MTSTEIPVRSAARTKNDSFSIVLDLLMMCDNLSLYKTYLPATPSPTVTNPLSSPFFPIPNEPNRSLKRKLSGKATGEGDEGEESTVDL